MKLRLSLLTLAVLTLGSAAFAAELSREDVKKVLEANPDLILDVLRNNRKDFFEIVTQAAQEEQGRRQKEAEEAQSKEIDDHIKNPMTPVITKKTRIRGNPKAKYTIVEYSDFQCPYCGRGYQTVETLRKKYGDDLRVIFKDKPLPFHAQARPAAQWFEAASLQSEEKAWAFHDKLFQNQDKLSEDFFKETAKSLGLDVDKLQKDVKSQAVQDAIDADIKEAEGFKFDGTPGFLLNGVPIRGAYPVEHFEEIIQKIEEARTAQASPEGKKASVK
jgi:protein-disulfide isomerase